MLIENDAQDTFSASRELAVRCLPLTQAATYSYSAGRTLAAGMPAELRRAQAAVHSAMLGSSAAA